MKAVEKGLKGEAAARTRALLEEKEPLELVDEALIPALDIVHLVGLSALMTTTLKSMEETIRALHDAKLDCKIMVGGAVLTPEYAKKIGADWYAKDAKQSADIAKEFFGV